MKQFRAYWSMIVASAVVAGPCAADQGGISFWLPGTFGSLAAAPAEPGWTYAGIYLHSSASAGGDVTTSRTIGLGDQLVNVTVHLDADIDANANIVALAPTYTFASPVFGGQLGASLMALGGPSEADVKANVTGTLGPIGFSASDSITDSLTSYGDLYPQTTLKWNDGANNTIVYAMMNIPIGDYDSDKLVNIGLGHWAIDGGGGYTYFDPKAGHEFSIVAGVTYNFMNHDLHYQNGIDSHIDWGASQFLSEHLHVGLVGYGYQQLTGDSGSGATLGDFKSRVFGVGPQIGYLFPFGKQKGYVNLKGYHEFGAENRAEGWSVWLAVAISP